MNFPTQNCQDLNIALPSAAYTKAIKDPHAVQAHLRKRSSRCGIQTQSLSASY